MKALFNIALLCTILHQSLAYSKYGRTCKDIGCPSNEVCVMAEDPCSYYNRDQCGSYPTCKSSGGSSSPSCASHICPPTQECHLDDGTPKCVASKTSSSNVHKNENAGQNPTYPAQNPSYPAQNPSYPAQNPSYPPQNPSHNPSAPSYPSGGSLYPSLTTSRPNSGGSSYPNYPSQSRTYPGYPAQAGYPSYPSQSNYPSYPNYPPQQGYQQNGYPSQGYPQYPGGYQQGYPQYPGYQNPNIRPGAQNTGSSPIVDKITEQLKTIGAGLLKNALSGALSGGNKQ